MRDYGELDNGLYVPPLRTDKQSQMVRMVSSPMMQYLTMATFSEWAWGEGNWETTWNLPVYSQLAMIQKVTMTGIDLIKQCNDLQRSKGWALTSMLARSINLARMSCLALGTGSFSDTFSSYRMLLDRLITLKYLEANDQYEEFEKFSYADLYQRINSRLNDDELRESYTSSEIKQYREMMTQMEVKMTETTTCAHHWVIEPGRGAISAGVCKLCGARNDFANSDRVLDGDAGTGRQPVGLTVLQRGRYTQRLRIRVSMAQRVSYRRSAEEAGVGRWPGAVGRWKRPHRGAWDRRSRSDHPPAATPTRWRSR